MDDKNVVELSTHQVNTWKFNDRQAKYKESRAYNNFIGSVVGILLLLLLIAAISKQVFTGRDLSFSGFLNWLGNLDSFQISVKISDFFIYSDWGLLNGLRDFINIFAQLFGVIVFMGANLINLLIYFVQFLTFLFA